MAFGYVLISHATYGGLYYTASFTATGAQPTWTKLTTTGMPALDTLDWLAVDPFNPSDRQFVHSSANRGEIYGRNGGNWSKLMDVAAAITLTGTGADDGQNNIQSIWCDPLIEGKIVTFCKMVDRNHYALVSADYGANWTQFDFYGGGSTIEEIKSLGTYYWSGANGNIGTPNFRAAYTPNSGGTLKYTANLLTGAAAGPPVVVDANDPTICYTANYSGTTNDLVRVDGDAASPMTLTTLQVNIGDRLIGTGARGDNMWIDPLDSTHMRLFSLYNGLATATLYYTGNTWSTKAGGTALGYSDAAALTHIQNVGNTTVVVLGSASAGGGVKIATLSTEADTTPEARDGTNAGSAPYADSIPRVGTLANYGIWVGEQPVTTGVYVYSVEMESDTGWATDVTDYAKIGTPMGGDRSSFRDMPADGFDVYHAEDVHAATPQIHAPWDDASPPPNGYGIISDGAKWEVSSDEIALAGDLHDAVTLDVDAAVLLDLNGQEIGLDTQTANTVFAGPATGAANEPTFRALVEADIDEILPLTKLSDVDTTGVGTGDIIYKSSGDWVDYPLGIETAIANDGGSIKIGDLTDGNYFQVSSDGEVTLTGDATAWEDLRVEPNVRQAAGAGVPSFEKYFDDLAGTSKGVYLYSFTDESVAANEKEVFFTMQMPHAWKVGSDISFHVHFVPAATVNSSDIIWGLEYTWKGIGEIYGDTTIVYSSTTLLPDDANITAGKHYLAEFTDIAPGTTASSLSSILIGRLFRNSSAGGDTYTNKVGLLYIDAHYQVDSFGSYDEYSKEVTLADSDGVILTDSDGIELVDSAG